MNNFLVNQENRKNEMIPVSITTRYTQQKNLATNCSRLIQSQKKKLFVRTASSKSTWNLEHFCSHKRMTEYERTRLKITNPLIGNHVLYMLETGDRHGSICSEIDLRLPLHLPSIHAQFQMHYHSPVYGSNHIMSQPTAMLRPFFFLSHSS